MKTIVDLENDLVKPYIDKEITTRAALGAHNLLNLSLAEIKSLNTSGTWNGNAYTFRGVTFTINDDLSISTSGTVNTGNLEFYLKNSIPLKNGTYKVIGCPSGASSYELLAIIGSTEYKDRGNGAEFTISNNTVSISIYTRLNQDMSGLTFKPQIILATDPSTEFTPYAMTNRDITQALAGEVIISSIYTSVEANTFENTGKSFTLDSPALIVVTIPYYNASVKGIAITKTNSLGDAYIVKEAVSLGTGLQAIGILGAGTWTIFASYIAASKSNPIKVFKIPICSNFA